MTMPTDACILDVHSTCNRESSVESSAVLCNGKEVAGGQPDDKSCFVQTCQYLSKHFETSGDSWTYRQTSQLHNKKLYGVTTLYVLGHWSRQLIIKGTLCYPACKPSLTSVPGASDGKVLEEMNKSSRIASPC
jgi:hypothetical protein